METGKLLFDVGVIIPPEYEEIYEGDKLKTIISLDPQIISGDPDLEVRLRYYIIDKETGNEIDIGIGESEWVLLDRGQQNLDKTFNVENLGSGTYELWLELKYEEVEGEWFYADLHSEFTVKKRDDATEVAGLFAILSGYKTVLLALGGAIFVLIVLIIVLIIRTGKSARKGRKKK